MGIDGEIAGRMPEIHTDIDAYYEARPERRSSPEADYGVHWTSMTSRKSWRVSYVRYTQEVYALELTGAPPGPVDVLGAFPSDPDAGPLDVYHRGLNGHLDGWPERCETPGGLVWVRDRLACPPDPGGRTHLAGWRDGGGHEHALCGDQAGLAYFLRQLREQPERAVTCRECVDIQNLPRRGERRTVRASSQHVCRVCGQLLGRREDPTWGIAQAHPGVNPAVNTETVWVCRNCWRDGPESLRLPEPVMRDRG